MITTSYGYKVPQTGDKGTPLFTALEQNITRVNDHTHDGVSSAPLTAQSIQGIQATISSAGWVAYGPTGHYRQLVTMVAGFSFDTCHMSFRTSTGKYIYPTVEKVAAAQFYVYTIDNSLDFVVTYGG